MWTWFSGVWRQRTVEVLNGGKVVACYAISFFGAPDYSDLIEEAAEEMAYDRSLRGLTGDWTFRVREPRPGDTEI